MTTWSVWLAALRAVRGKSRDGHSMSRPDRYLPRVELLEDRLAPATFPPAATFVWTGGAGTGKLSAAANWSNAATGAAGTPGTGDSLVFPLNGPAAPGTVTDDIVGTTSFNSITFLSNGWTVAAAAGSAIGVTNGINQNTNTAGTNTISAPLSFVAASSSVGVNVTNPNTAATVNQLVLNGAVDLGGNGLTFGGQGTLVLGGTVSDTGGIVANGPGTLKLSAANTYGGGTTINNGIVSVSTNSTALGTAAVTVNSGGTLQIATTISNALSLNGLGFNSNGALVAAQSAVAVTGVVTLQSNASINVGSNQLTLTGTNGNVTGSIGGTGSLTVVGNNGTLVDEDLGSYTGVTNILGVNFTLASPAAGQTGGKNTSTSGYVVSQGGALAVNNNAAVTNDRFGNTAVELDGGTLNINTAGAGTPSSETFSALTLGVSAINPDDNIVGSNTVNLGPGNNTVMVTALNRVPGSTVTFVGTNLGSGNDIKISNYGTGAGPVQGILPYADAGTSSPATGFATSTANGIAVAAPTNTVSTGGNFPAPGTGVENYLITGAITVTLTADTFINSLILTGGATLKLNGHQLLLGSGGLLVTTTTATATTIDGAGAGSSLGFGTQPGPTAVEGIITAAGLGSLSLNTVPITVGTDLTLNLDPTGAGGGLTFAGTPTASTYTGTTWVTSGTLVLNAGAIIVPQKLVIGDAAGGSAADVVQVTNSARQLGGDVAINSSGELLISGVSQSIGNLTLSSGLASANATLLSGSILTVVGAIASRGVVLSPTTGLTFLPDAADFKPSQITQSGGVGDLVLAPGSGTTSLNVTQTPAIVDGGEEDLQIGATLANNIAIIDKVGAGTVVITTLPAGSFAGAVQVDGGRFAIGVAGFSVPIVVDGGGILGSDGATLGSTGNAVTADGGRVTPSLGPTSPFLTSPQAVFTNSGADDLSSAGVVSLHIGGYGGPGKDSDQLVSSTGGNVVTLGTKSVLEFDLLGLAQGGTLTGANSPFIWAGSLNGRFSDAPSVSNNILPAADVFNNPTGFQVIVSYGAGFLTVTLTHPPTVLNSSYTTGGNTPLVVNTRAAGVLASLTDTDFVGAVSQATLDTVLIPGMLTGSAGGKLALAANGTFTYTPVANFAGTETFTFQAVNPGGGTSSAVTVTFTVTAGAPTVSGVNPTTGSEAGGTRVIITGSNFIGVTAVRFGTIAATSFTVNSATQITATSPAGSGTVDVTVISSAGSSATSNNDQFTYLPAPIVLSVGPSEGPTLGGTSVTITGSNFTGVTAVDFGSIPATSFTVNSPTSITAIAPPAVGGTVDITVVTSGGASANSTKDQFTFQPGSPFDELAAYRSTDGSWSLDSNGQFGFQTGGPEGPSPLSDRVLLKFSPTGANVQPVSGDWTGIGTSEVGDFENGTWHLDLNNNGIRDPGETFTFGQAGDLPVPGNYLPGGGIELAVFRSFPAQGYGMFIISDKNWLAEAQAGQTIGISTSFIYGAAGDRVVVGDWNGAGLTEVGVFRSAAAFGAPNAAVFSLDIANHHAFDTSNKVFIFGTFTDGVVIGDWDGSGTSKVGVYRPATAFGAPNTAVFSLDETGDFQFDANSKVFLFGLATDKYVTGRWAYTTGTASAQAPTGANDVLSAPLTVPTALDAFFAAP